MALLRRIYYAGLRPLLSRSAQLALRRVRFRVKHPFCRAVWPVLASAGTPPENWRGWPDGKRFALVLTHDVEGLRGYDRCPQVMELEAGCGMRSCMNFVPECYMVTDEFRAVLAERDFEVGVHGLRHDAKLFNSRRIFQERSVLINDYIHKWGAAGFRSPAMLRNLEWIRELDIEYDASTFDTDPFEPQPEGVGTVFPFWVPGGEEGDGYVELPYTLPQDLTLFGVKREKDIAIWKEKLDWVAEAGGMALVLTHPDYMDFDGASRVCDEYPARLYEDLLRYVKAKYEGEYWHALPREVARFWRGRDPKSD